MATAKFQNLQMIFDQANAHFDSRNYTDYVEALIRLHSELQCNCFFRSLDEEIFQDQVEVINSTNFDTPDWSENFAKGFIYLKSKEDSFAYHYLTTAIDLREHPLLYSLRAEVNSRENPNRLSDINKALQLDPSARNYFKAANLWDELKSPEAATNKFNYLTKAIKLEPDFACAYNNRAGNYAEEKNYDKAIADYKSCVQQQPDHWAYKSLIKYLLMEKKIGEALFYSNLAIQNVDDDDKEDYILQKVEVLVSLEEFEEALNQLRRYHEEFPENFKIEYEIEKTEEKRINCYLRKAQESFEKRDFLKASIFYQLYKDNKKPLFDQELSNFLQSLIQINNKDFVLEEEKEKFQMKNLDHLKEYQSHHQLNFGKYKGKKLDEIKLIDPGYILWCVLNLDHFTIPNTLFLQAVFKNEPSFYPALELNFVKQKSIPPQPQYLSYEDDYMEPNPLDSEYYNDSLDMDQQSPEFWDSI